MIPSAVLSLLLAAGAGEAPAAPSVRPGAEPGVTAAVSVTNAGGATDIADRGRDYDDIGGWEARLNGTLSGGPAEVTVYWGETDGGANPANWMEKIDLGRRNPGRLSADLKGLAHIRTYHYRFSATGPGGASWAPSTASFTTGAIMRDWDPTEPRELPDIISRIVGYDEVNVRLRKKDGEVVEFPVGRLHASDLAYLRAFRSKLPPVRSALDFEGRLVIDLEARDLPLGPLERWKSRGELPCTFHSINDVHPRVVVHDGRKAVELWKGRATVGMDYAVMAADAGVPACLTDGSGFSAAFWLWNEEPLRSHDVFFGMRNLDLKGLEFDYSKKDKHWAGEGAGKVPKAGAWHHVVYTYSGGRDSRYRIYVDGELIRDEKRSWRESRKNLRFFLGNWTKAWNWVPFPDAFTGFVSDVKVYDGELAEGEVWELMARYGAYPLHPMHEATIEELGPTLRWARAPDAARFDVYMSTDPATVGAGSAAALRARTQAASFSPGVLERGATYHCRVDTYDAKGGKVEGPVWRFTVSLHGATEPRPAAGADEVDLGTSRLAWKPGRHAATQNAYFGTDLADMQGAPAVKGMGGKASACPMPAPLEMGKAYHWRIDAVNGDGSVSKGPVWSFRTKTYFLLEDDGVVVEPTPAWLEAGGYWAKVVFADGFPVFGPAIAPDAALLAGRATLMKAVIKRPDVRDVMIANRGCATLAGEDRKTSKASQKIASESMAYGGVGNMMPGRPGTNMFLHEVGHHFHILSCERAIYEFRSRVIEVYDHAMESRLWTGGYSAKNKFEYMATAANKWCNDGYPVKEKLARDHLRGYDPRLYYLMNSVWAADRRVDLVANKEVESSPDGVVRSWRNLGGIHFWNSQRQEWQYLDGTVGVFEAIGDPVVKTVAGVTAIELDGDDGFVWDLEAPTRMTGDLEWSAEMWVYKDAHKGGRETLVSWAPEGAGAAALSWDGAGRAYGHGPGIEGGWKEAPSTGEWHHLAFVFGSGRTKPGEAAEYRLYVDGRLDGTRKANLDIARGGKVTIGVAARLSAVRAQAGGAGYADGFKGAVSQVRLYDYDLHELELREHYEAGRDHHDRGGAGRLAVAGRLLVDLDATALADVADSEHRPFYPETIERRWLRSWANRGSLGGRMHNDVREGGRDDPRSNPTVETAGGVRCVRFDGDDRMTSSFMVPECVARGNPWSVEAWVLDGPPGGATVLQWIDGESRDGPAQLAAGGGRGERHSGWHHYTAVYSGREEALYVDGRRVSSRTPGRATGRAGRVSDTSNRFHIAASWSGSAWSRYFTGAVAELRLHAGALSAGEIASNFAGAKLNRARHPEPRDRAERVSPRAVLRWAAGVNTARTGGHDVYLGTDPKAVGSASKGSREAAGTTSACEFRPKGLEPGTTYYWRIDERDERDGAGAGGFRDGKGVRKGEVWSFTTRRGALVDLEAAKLPAGRVTRWRNEGALGGHFGNEKPTAVAGALSGRKAVTFSGKTSYLTSSFETPDCITRTNPFTVEAWVLNPEIEPDRRDTETILSFAPDVRPPGHNSTSRGRYADFAYGASVTDGPGAFSQFDPRKRGIGWKDRPPEAGRWHHVVYTYSGGTFAEFSVYVDGRLSVSRDHWTVNTDHGHAMILGAGEHWKEGVRRHFTGSVASLRVYDAALTAEEVRERFERTSR